MLGRTQAKKSMEGMSLASRASTSVLVFMYGLSYTHHPQNGGPVSSGEIGQMMIRVVLAAAARRAPSSAQINGWSRAEKGVMAQASHAAFSSFILLLQSIRCRASAYSMKTL